MAEWRHHWAEVNGLTMHYVEQGEGPLVVLAHGFPHSWFSWRHQIAAIAAAREKPALVLLSFFLPLAEPALAAMCPYIGRRHCG